LEGNCTDETIAIKVGDIIADTHDPIGLIKDLKKRKVRGDLVRRVEDQIRIKV
jgi:hypothetical protein